MRPLGLAFPLAVLLLMLLPPSSGASANELTFRFQSNHPNIVDVELYSDTRRGHVWPGNGRIYVLDDYDVNTIRIGCRRGERICFGAWVRNQSNSYWGVGRGNVQRCSSCCYTCNGGQTNVIVLNP